MLRKCIFIFFVVSIISCKDISEMKSNLGGYWEISEVKQGRKVLKQFKISENIDYFELNENEDAGFRKKLKASLNGNFQATDHQTNFKLSEENNALFITYSGIEGIFTEEVIEASAEKLVLKDSSGISYIYKPFEPITIPDE